jgi:hypothetical protein
LPAFPQFARPILNRTVAATYLEKHFTVQELAGMWAIGRETVRLLVKDEPDVLKIRMGRKQAHTRYSIPESVAKRIYLRLQNAA